MLNQPSHIKDIDGYVFFSDRTKGSSGKPVKIHVSLFMDFLSAVDTESHDGRAVAFDIEGLKNSAKANSITPLPQPRNSGGTKHESVLARLRNINNIMAGKSECSLITKNVRIYYHVHQKDGDKCPTVYISEIQAISGSNTKTGGLHEKQQSRGRSNIRKVDSINLEGRTLFVSRAMTNTNDAMREAQYLTDTHNPALFFNPPSVTDDLGIWKQPRLTQSTKNLVNELERTIKENQKKKVNWIVQGEGAAVLAQALKNVSGSLESHNFKFNNPRANLPKLLQSLSQKRASLNGEFITHSCDRTSLLAIASQRQELVAEIGGLAAPQGFDNISRRYLVDRINNLGRGNKIIAQQQSLRSGSTTFIAAVNSANRIK